jgi:hypothetical protein
MRPAATLARAKPEEAAPWGRSEGVTKKESLRDMGAWAEAVGIDEKEDIPRNVGGQQPSRPNARQKEAVYLLRQGGNARIPWGRHRGGAVNLTCGARRATSDLATHCPDREPENNRGEDCTSSPRPYASLAIADDRRTACWPLKGI